MALVRRRTVLIADDHELLAKGIAGLLSAVFEVVGLVSNGRELIETAQNLRPDIIVVDVSMPEMNGIEAAGQLRKLMCGAKVVFVTQQSEPNYVRAAFRAGATGYVSKQSRSEELISALQAIAVGELYLDSSLHAKLGFIPLTELQKAQDVPDGLTQRQREVLQLLAEGKSTREISASLGVAPKTVEFHKKALMDRTGLRTTAELTRYAVSTGYVVP